MCRASCVHERFLLALAVPVCMTASCVHDHKWSHLYGSMEVPLAAWPGAASHDVFLLQHTWAVPVTLRWSSLRGNRLLHVPQDGRMNQSRRRFLRKNSRDKRWCRENKCTASWENKKNDWVKFLFSSWIGLCDRIQLAILLSMLLIAWLDSPICSPVLTMWVFHFLKHSK